MRENSHLLGCWNRHDVFLFFYPKICYDVSYNPIDYSYSHGYDDGDGGVEVMKMLGMVVMMVAGRR